MQGRPTKFSDALSAKMIRLYEKGKTDKQVAKILGISLRSIYVWKGKHPDFLHALKEAKGIADDLVEASLFQRAIGYSHPEEKVFIYNGRKIVHKTVKHYPPDPTSGIFWLKNRNPDAWRETKFIVPQHPDAPIETGRKRTYQEFCAQAGYAAPFPKQIEMMEFGVNSEEDAHLLLGSRGYGKTDYVVILGLAYKIYLDPLYTALVITKSGERSGAILKEICTVLKANGVELESENARFMRAKGVKGKDNSVSGITVGATSIRGRHPKIVVMDDPVTEEDTSETTRNKVQAVYNEVSKLCKNILIIGQPVHKYDLYQTLRGIVRCMEVPHGSIPELDHDLEAQRLAGVSEESIQASYFLKVISQGATPFDKIKYIDDFPKGDSVAFIDPSFRGGDYTALTIIRAYFDGVAVYGKVYKKSWDNCIDEMAVEMKTHGVRRLAFECNCLGEQPLNLLRQALPGVGVIGKDSTTNKHSRIMAAGTFAHLIHLSKKSDRTYIDHVVKYEYGAKYDDAPDSLASALVWIGLVKGK